MYKAKAVTYTGAHFRGMDDDTDSCVVMLTFANNITEAQLVEFMLENFSYGADEHEMQLDKYIDGLNEGAIAQFDGCGGVLKLWRDDTLLYDYYNGNAAEEAMCEGEALETNPNATVYEYNVTQANLMQEVADGIGKLYKLNNVLGK